jgi:hypothetical protein
VTTSPVLRTQRIPDNLREENLAIFSPVAHVLMSPATGKIWKRTTLVRFCWKKIKSKMSSAPSARTLSVQSSRCCACGDPKGDKPLRDVDWEVVLPLKYFPLKICRQCDEKNKSKIQVFSASRHGFCDDARASLGAVFIAATRAIDE